MDREEICRKLRETVKEFSEDVVSKAVLIGTLETNHVGGLEYLTAPTVSETTLGNVDYKVARYFEDV